MGRRGVRGFDTGRGGGVTRFDVPCRIATIRGSVPATLSRHLRERVARAERVGRRLCVLIGAL